MQRVCKYPIVFVHGLFGWGGDEGINRKLPYWGATTGNLMQFLNDEGFECYSGSVGPISSAWDRACELYARLTGTQVDYGAVHSARVHHRRFGRTYKKPLFDGWDPEKKIHLIGHSFGGNTIRMLAYLLTYGDADEREGTDPKELSGLFTGGKEDWIQSIVTLCAPHNGTFCFDALRKYKLIPLLQAIIYNGAGILGRTPAEGKIVDYHLEQYGMSDTPGKEDAYPLRRARRQYMRNNDNIEYDMSAEGAQKLNKSIKISPHIYYFSYAFNAVTKTGNRIKASETDFPFLKATSSMMRLYSRGMGADKQDMRNDGLVQVTAALHPDDEPFTDYDSENVRPGVWQVMPLQVGDHGTPIGLFADKEKTHAFYFDILEMLRRTEDAQNEVTA
jgi:triacylglycerol lipase